MSVEQNLKVVIGENVFQICVLQDLLEQANKELAEYKAKDEK